MEMQPNVFGVNVIWDDGRPPRWGQWAMLRAKQAARYAYATAVLTWLGVRRMLMPHPI